MEFGCPLSARAPPYCATVQAVIVYNTTAKAKAKGSGGTSGNGPESELADGGRRAAGWFGCPSCNNRSLPLLFFRSLSRLSFRPSTPEPACSLRSATPRGPRSDLIRSAKITVRRWLSVIIYPRVGAPLPGLRLMDRFEHDPIPSSH